MLQKQWPEAAVAFREALARQPLPLLAVRRYSALQNAGKPAEASAMADKWFKDHPKDVTLRAYIAQQSARAEGLPASQFGNTRSRSRSSPTMRCS